MGSRHLNVSRAREKSLRQQQIARIDPLRHFQLRWLEQWDVDTLLTDNVDLGSTQAAFAIPLVDLAVSPSLHISLSMSYSSSDVGSNGLLGNGWTLHHAAEDFIIVDHKQSFFEHNHQYQLSIQGQFVNLVRNKDVDNQFSIDNQPDIQITFMKDQNRWVIDTPNLRTVYGSSEDASKVPDALQWSLHWPFWRGPGKDEEGLEQEVLAWYLVSREEKHGLKRKLFYKYYMENRTTEKENKSFTSVIQLDSVYDAENKFKLELLYDTKERNEYPEKSVKNQQGSIQFPVYLVAKHYLLGYHLQTESFQQQLQFMYNINSDGVRTLSQVNQVFNEVSRKAGEQEEIFTFAYTEVAPMKHMLTTLEIPRYHSGLNLEYAKLQIPLLKFDEESLNTQRYPAVDNVQINQGEDFSTMSFDIEKGTGGIYIRVFNREMTKMLTEIYTGEANRPAADEPNPAAIVRFATLVFPNLIAVVEETGEEKRLHLFNRSKDSNEWPSTPSTTIKLKLDSVFRYTEEFMVISKNDPPSLGELLLIVPDPKPENEEEDSRTEEGYTLSNLKLTNGANLRVDRLVAQDGVILAYNGQRLHAWRENEVTGIWDESVITELVTQEEAFFKRFEMDEEVTKQIREQINVSGLHMTDNMVLLVAIEWTDGNLNSAQVSTNAHLILLNDQLKKAREEKHVIKSEKIGSLQKVDTESLPGTTLWIRYKENTSVKKFQGYLHDIAGRELDDACKDWDDKDECKKEVLKAYNDSESFKAMLIFNVESLFTFRLEPTGASTKETKLEMTGTGWTKVSLNEGKQIKLGNLYLLNTFERRNDSETDYALYRQNPENGDTLGTALGNWTLHNEDSGMAVGYPSYLGMQSDVLREPVLLPFRETGEDETEIKLGTPGEVLLQSSNHEMLFTLIDAADPNFPSFDKKLIVRRVNSVIPSTPVWVLSKSEVQHENLRRVRIFENHFNCSSPNIAQENVLRVTPADSIDVTGYYEEVTVIPIQNPLNATKTQNWYDARGESIRTRDVDRTVRQKQEEKEEEENAKRWQKIWDWSGELEISDISPYNRTDQTVAYFGFEPYENNSIPFTFSEESVINDFSFTGENLLRLKSGENVHGSLTPTNQETSYVISSWIRFPPANAPIFEFEKPVEEIRANLATHTGYSFLGLYGQLKRFLKDWYYVEIIMDLDKIRNNVYAEVYRHSSPTLNLPPPSTTNFTISLDFNGPELGGYLDLDHIRFSPVTLDLAVTVYNPRTGKETSQLLSDGSVLHKIYDDYGTEITTVDESGQVEQLKSLSRSGFIFPPPVADTELGVQEVRREVIQTPDQGQLIIFDKYCRQNLFDVEDDEDTDIWSISRGKVVHISNAKHTISAKSPDQLFDPESSAIRLSVHFTSAESSISVSVGGISNLISFNAAGVLNIASGCQTVSNLPTAAELLFALSENTLWVWLNGVLMFDRTLDKSCLKSFAKLQSSPWNQFEIEVNGPLTLTNLITLAQPQISVEHFNAWGERTQSVILENSNTALVSETLYDEQGRDAIKIKATRIQRAENYNPLLVYYPDFVRNRYPRDVNSVFTTGTVDGLANSLNPPDEGYPYSRTLYQDDMLREVRVEGLPGKAFSTFGTFNKQHHRHSGLEFLQILFPYSRGFREKVTYEPNGNVKVIVLDSAQNEVAEYVKVPGFDNILTIYEYDEEGKLLKILPPKYHAQMRTYLRTRPWNFGDENLTEEELFWQGKLGTHFRYDEMNQVISKRAPDHKTKGFLYDPMGNMRFMYTLSPGNETLSKEDQVAEDIVYMLHSGQNKPVEVGYFQQSVTVGSLTQFQNGTALPNEVDSQIHQRILYSDTHADPEVRGKVRLFLTYDDHHEIDPTRSGGQSPPHQELLKFNAANQVIMKTSNALYTGSFSNYQKHYKGRKIKEMAYPRTTFGLLNANETTFNLMHGHDKLGRLTQLGTRTEPSAFAQISFNAAGQIEEEFVDPVGVLKNSVNRKYNYNAPGLLTGIQDQNLAQSISYIEGGYGQEGHGEGILMNSLMSAAWSNIQSLGADQQEWFRIPQENFENDKTLHMCINALKRVGIVDADTNIPIQQLTQSLLDMLPLSCSGSVGYQLMQLVAQYLPPTSQYGHAYSYGNHKELTKAKFVANDGSADVGNPLMISSFTQLIPEINSLASAEKLWDILQQSGFIIVENGLVEDKSSAIGKQGKSLFQYSSLEQDLAGLGQETFYALPIVKLLYHKISEGQQMVELGEFQDIFINWHGYEDTPTPTIIKNMARQDAAKIYTMLEANEYLAGNINKILDPVFTQALQEFSPQIQTITKVLTDHFGSQMGTNLFDYESFYIDPNGNQGMFYAGLQRHELEYDGDSNQVKRLKVRIPFATPGEDEIVTEFTHDSQGNVNMAEHKGIKLIKYHPVINRPMLIEMFDGRRILIKYDGQGERLLKRVFATGNTLISETKYLRDENGQVLMDKLTQFGEDREILKETETTYLYGPRGVILGFIRNGKFYNVFTDHAGSTRLITQSGKAVAGYDYWPYGELVRSFGEEDAQLLYRFTGQEYDPETGLYNYHARLYDPTIGRFFQPDPKSQYASPYVYGGNSPISFVDPDGEFFGIILAIVGAIVGAYLAGAAANGSWNPFKWNWKSDKTWLAIFGGAIGGAMLPGAFAAAAASIGTIPAILVGVAGSYLKMAQQNKSWNPLDWDWTNPATYNAFLEGFSTGLKQGTEAWTKAQGFITNFSKTGQKLLSEVASGAGFALIKGAVANDRNFKFWEWDWSDPETLSAIKDGFFTGKGFPEQATKAYRNFADMAKNADFGKMLTDMKGTTKNFMKDVFKNPKHPLWKTMGKAVISFVATGKDQGTLDFTKWDWNSLSTYESMLNNYKIGSELKDMMETYRKKDWLLAGIDFSTKEILRSIEASPIVERLHDGLDDVWNFYNLPKLPFKKRQEYVDKFMGMSLAAKMFWDLQQQQMQERQARGEEEDDDEFTKAMEKILGGLRSGTTIYPVLSEEIAGLIDCESVGGIRNGTKADDGFEKCSIGTSNGKMSRQNSEFVHTIFTPSALYQSKNDFVEVKHSSEPQEFGEHLLQTFAQIRESRNEFYTSFLIGTVYYSLLNNGSTRKTFPMYFLNENVDDLGLTFAHVALLRENTLAVRTLVVVSEEQFGQLRSTLASKLKSLDFPCYLPNPEEAYKVNGESLVIVTDSKAEKGSQVYVMTPNYSAGSTAPDCSQHPKFLPISNDLSTTVFEAFQGFAEDGISSAEKAQRYEQLLIAFGNNKDAIAQSLLPEVSFSAMVFGMLSANLQNTFSLALDITKGGEVFFALQRNSHGASSWYGTPAFILQESHGDPSSRLLHKSSLLSLSQEAMIGRVGNDNSVNIETVSLPKFSGIEKILSGSFTVEDVESLLQYMYHNHHSTKQHIAPVVESSHFISNFVLGELFSRMETSSWDMFAYAPQSLQDQQQRLAAQRMFILRNPETTEAIVLNIIESSIEVNGQFEFDSSVPMNIPTVPNVTIGQLKMVTVKINPKSKAGWNVQESPVEEVTPEQVFLQDISISNESVGQIPKNDEDFLKLDYSVKANLPQKLSFSKSYISDMFDKLKANKLRLLLNTDDDLGSIVMGLLMGASIQMTPDVDGVNVVLRTIASKENAVENQISAALSLLSLTKEGLVVPQTEQILVAGLKTSATGNEESINDKLTEAKEELADYHCSRESRLKEAFKISSVPAVYDSAENPVSGDRVWFEVDPPELLNLNCSANPNPFQDYVRQQYKANQTSGSKPESHENDITTEKCHMGAWVSGDGYSMEGITCTSGKSTVAVFKHIQENDVVTLSSRGQPFNLVGDKYEKDRCTPITWNGKPGAACKGEKTTLIYTPHIESRMFDEVDRQLMLGRVAMHWGAKLWNFVRHGAQPQSKVTVHMVDEEIFSDWERDLSKAKVMVGSWEGKRESVEWAERDLKECEEMMVEIRQAGFKTQPEVVEDITERLGAIQEDLAEQLLFATVDKLFADKGRAPGEAASGLGGNWWENGMFHGLQNSFANSGLQNTGLRVETSNIHFKLD